MKENNALFEGFWDTLITKAKQGAFAVAGAAGSGTAKGKLTVSLLSDSMYSQFKEFLASTGSQTTPEDFADFLGRMGFSQKFVADETAQFKNFLNAIDPINNPAQRAEPTADAQPQQAPSREQGTIDRNAKRSARKPFPNSSPADAGDAAKPAANAEPEKAEVPKAASSQSSSDAERVAAQKQMQQRMQQKRAEGPRAKKTREGEEGGSENMLTEKVSDGSLRKFFNTLAQRALKSGEAKSAAQKTIADTRTSNAGEDQPQAQASTQSSQAQQPAQTQAQPQAQAQTVPATAPSAQQTKSGRKPFTNMKGVTQAPAQPAAQPATQPAAPAQPQGLNIPFTDREKEIMAAFPADTKLGPQVKASDPEVQELAQKVLQAAFDDFKRNNPNAAMPAPKAPKQQQRKVTPTAPAQPAAPANQPAANQANPQAPAA